jgi:hypothetical protein
MKRYIIILLACIFISPLIYAQDNKKVFISVLGGINFFQSTYQYADAFHLPEHDASLGYSIGAGIAFNLTKNFFLELELLYKSKKSELVEFSGLEWGDTFFQFHYLALPLLGHYRFAVSEFDIFPTLGLEFNYLLKSRVEDKKNGYIIESIENSKSYDLQIIAGLGLGYQKFSVEFRLYYGLLNLNEEKENDLVVKNKGYELIFAFFF